VALRPTLFAEWNDRQTRLEAELFYRHDSLDDARSHGDVRSLYLQHFARDWDVLAGFARVNWGVTESRKLVDVVNQSDFVEDLASDDKLGQAMIALSWRTAPGTLDVYLLPYARARTFPGPRGQPRVGFDFAPEEARYESSAGQERVDLAARWRMRFGALDVNLSVFDGTARDPDILPCLRRGSPFEGTDARANCDLIAAVPPPRQPLPDVVFTLLQGLGLVPDDAALMEQFIAEQTPGVLANLVLVPSYPLQRQLGLEAQYITGPWALKLEALARERAGVRSNAVVAGVEYTTADPFGRGWDVTALAEVLYDDRRTLINSRSDHDLFLGTRLSVNDIAGSLIEAGLFVDRAGNDHAMQVEAGRRLGNAWRVAVTARHFERVPREPFITFLRDESMARISLTRFF